MVASITELHLKGLLSFLRFAPHAVRSKIQADQAPGLKSARVRASGLFIQRTLTVWENEKAMRDYVRSGPHLEAMKLFSKIANKSSTAVFAVTTEPTWDEALKVLRERGRTHG